MKNLLMMLTVAVGFLLPAKADYEMVDGIKWSYKVEGNIAIVEAVGYQAAIDPQTTGNVIIPSTLGGYPVKSIGSKAFFKCSAITNVVIPSAVTNIGGNAFYSCSKLEKVTIPNGVTSIGSSAFFKCSELKSVTIPESVRIIDYGAFTQCSALESVVIPSGVKALTNLTFSGCTKLETVTLPYGLSFLATNAFKNCSSLKSVCLPDAYFGGLPMSKVADFSACPASLELRYCGTNVVDGRTWHYQKIYGKGGSLTTIRGMELKNIKAKTAAASPVTSGCQLTIPERLYFSDDSNFVVTGLGTDALYGCKMANVTIPSTVTSIADFAFYKCSRLLYVKIPDSVRTLGAYAFSYCTNMTALTIGSGLSTLPEYAFWNCDVLKSVTIPESVTEIQYRAFISCRGLTSLKIGSNVRVIGAGAFRDCASLTAVTLPDSVTSLGNAAFYDCTSLKTASLPGILKGKLGSLTFMGCPYGLVVTYRPLFTIEDGVLKNVVLYGATSVTIPSTVTGIWNRAFFSLKELENVTIPPSVTSISTYAFDNCSGLKSFTVVSGNPSFTSVNGLLLTKDGKTLVRGVNGAVTIPVGVMTIRRSAFSGFSNLTRVTIPESVKVIEAYAFYMTGLTTVAIPAGVKIINEGVFANCDALTRVTIPNSVTTIGHSAFAQCDALTRMTIPNGVLTINSYAFYSCDALTSVTIPTSVMNIEEYAFADCVSLTSALLPKRLEGKLDESSVFECCPESLVITYCDTYTIRFHRNEASDELVEEFAFPHGVDARLPSLKSLGWARKGFDFKGWATSQANADAGKVWKADWALVSAAIAVGKALNVWAVWELKSDSYAITFIRNDGSGTWRTVGFTHGEKTRLPSMANGLGWARRGYVFKGWALTTAAAAAGTVWKPDWAYVATAAAKGKTLTVYAVWELKTGFYEIRYNKNNGTGAWRTLGYEYGVSTKLATVNALGWSVSGKTFKGWATSKANADAKKVWKTDGAAVETPIAAGKTLGIYAIWQ